MQSDTIAAISTGMTNAGIGKVRLSGDDAVTIVDRIYRSPGGRKRLSDVSTHTIHYGYIYDGDYEGAEQLYKRGRCRDRLSRRCGCYEKAP